MIPGRKEEERFVSSTLPGSAPKQPLEGLDEATARQLLATWGANTIPLNENKKACRILLDIIREPMFLLLALAGLLYFVMGETGEGFLMVTALCLVAAISLYQEIKSAHALAALAALTERTARVIREGAEKQVPTETVVPGDLLLIDEGGSVAADAVVIRANDLEVNEAMLTGESLPVEKTVEEGSNLIYQGTVVVGGRCLAEVTATGQRTALGRIGKSMVTYEVSKTAFQDQMARFIRRLALFGIAMFVIIFFLNYLRSHHLVGSFLFGLTLAMSAIPEELPVAFSSFTALDAYHLSRRGIISRQPQTIENLGAVSVICLDKTGTITENRMEVKYLYDFATKRLSDVSDLGGDGSTVLLYGMLASETDPFDRMEQAITACNKRANPGSLRGRLIGEYRLEGHPPMMTHVFERNGTGMAAAKGAPERIIRVCGLSEPERASILALARDLAGKGHRVVGVARAEAGDTLPQNQEAFAWNFVGLISLYDPPRPFIRQVLGELKAAGISLRLLTGDFPETACAIAAETGLSGDKKFVTGREVMEATDETLRELIAEHTVFARMYPEAKLRVIRSLVQGKTIVAMTGDGVNDGPALKAAHIGIALGKSGAEVARQAADLIVTDDDLRKVSEAILQGRKIFSNLKKAVRYILSIHIPIILTASLPLLLNWKYPNIFTPIHVVFLELIMGPTCSIFYEREPVEPRLMKVPPRKTVTLFSKSEVVISIVQGLAITVGVLGLEFYFTQRGASLEKVRTIVFTTLLLANVCLTFTNRSFTQTIIKTARYRNHLSLPLLLVSACFLLLLFFVAPVRQLFGLEPILPGEFFLCLAAAVFSVGWFEIFKGLKSLQPTPVTDAKQTFS